MNIEDQWEKIDIAGLKGLVMVVGEIDTGKSTLCRYLFERFCEDRERVGFLDGDPGQSRLGPPTTMSLGVPAKGRGTFPPSGSFRRIFVQSTTPAAHMLQVASASARLAWAGFSEKADTIVYDTTGLIDPKKGGLNLKLAKIALMRPSTVIGIQREKELNTLLVPLRKSRRCRIISLSPSPSVQPRDRDVRRQNRENNFKAYFSDSRQLEIKWRRFAVFPTPDFKQNRLVGFEDRGGFCVGLGIVLGMGANQGTVALTTPIKDLSGLNAIRIGDITIDPETFQHERIR